jgi:hypothetical protein
MTQPKTITMRRQTFVAIVACLAFSTYAHLFRLAVDFIR